MVADKPQPLKITGGRIREFRMEDYEAVVNLWEKVGLAKQGESTKESFLEQQKLAKDLFLVYEVDGKVVGTVIGGWDGWRAWIYRIAVDPEHQRRGLGSRLIAEIEKRLEAKGGRKFRALILAGNEVSKSLFEANGFYMYDKIVLGTKDSQCC